MTPIEALHAHLGPSVLELGTLRWGPASTTHEQWLPAGAVFVRSDVEQGLDVDVVADAHDLAPFEDETFDVVIACSVWEHLARPWVAMGAVARVLRPGGVVYVDTHQTYPLHGYPHDYWRFSTESLAMLCTDAGLEVLSVEYHGACRIEPEVKSGWNDAAEAWLGVHVCALKPLA